MKSCFVIVFSFLFQKLWQLKNKEEQNKFKIYNKKAGKLVLFV